MSLSSCICPYRLGSVRQWSDTNRWESSVRARQENFQEGRVASLWCRPFKRRCRRGFRLKRVHGVFRLWEYNESPPIPQRFLPRSLRKMPSKKHHRRCVESRICRNSKGAPYLTIGLNSPYRLHRGHNRQSDSLRTSYVTVSLRHYYNP